jgi:PKD repeat protein
MIGLLTGCAGDLVLPGTGGSIAIRVVGGDDQTGEVGHLLGAPVVVEVRDEDSALVANATVVFELTSAGDGAAIIPDTVTTGSDGQAQAEVLLGQQAGELIGEARVVVDSGTPPSAQFSATATSGSTGNPENRPPHADFRSHCEDLGCQFTDASTDEDGSVTAWSWQFGDGASSDQAEPGHSYLAPGTYSVTLTITDNQGATDQSTAQIEVTAPPPPPQSNEPPQADFDVHCHELDCSFTDKSVDDDGSVTGWLWQFGDGFISTEQNPRHSYGHDGHYNVTLTVTDDQGATDSRSHDVKTD